jgi:hypothetical protein
LLLDAGARFEGPIICKMLDYDWVGCAKALVDHGMPVRNLDCHFGISPFSDEVTEFFAELNKE